jgi:hypothetical protein
MLERNAPSANYYLQKVEELERALLRYVKAVHENGRCGGNGHHRAECSVLFHELGWDSFEEYAAAMQTAHRGA